VVAQGALKDAGYGKSRDFNRDNVSVVLGLTGTLELVVPLGARLGHPIWRKAMLHAGIPENITSEVIDNIGKSYVSWQENSFPGLLGNVAAGRIANRLDLGGTNCVVDAACGSALSALNLAAMELWAGKSDMAITGGVDTFNDIFMYMCFCKTPALSPTGNARPFSEDNDGTILGEGIGMFVIKRLSDAEKDGDKIYALINSVASSSDGKGKAIYAPSAKGQVKVLRRAYEQAGIEPTDISLLEAHGTGTGAGDEVEINALTEVYGKSETSKPWCAIGSVKSQIGHTKAAAGSAGILKAAMALHHKVIPPTIKVSKPAKPLREKNMPFYLPDRIRPWVDEKGTGRYAAISSLGFGGSNYHVVLSEYTPEKRDYDWKPGIELAALSGKTIDDLKQKLNKVQNITSIEEKRTWAAQSRNDFSVSDNLRLCFAFTAAGDELKKIASDVLKRFDNDDEIKSFDLPNGIYFANEKKDGPIGVIFPGQGSQYPHMGLEVNCMSPESFKVLQASDQKLGALDSEGNRLIDYLYPRPTYDSELDAQNDEKLRATEIAQPAIGSVSIGQYRLLEKLGLEAEAFAGHSYGELTSLCAAGAFDEAALAEISRKRGELMAGGEGDRGGMIAIAAPRDKVEQIVKDSSLDLVVANHNSPKQVVLSGKTEEIQRAETVFKENKIRGTVLKVAGAFHSSYVADAGKPYQQFLKNIKFAKPVKNVYANSTALPYPQKANEIKDILGNQIANPVRFVELIEKMYADGIRTFVEVGPGGKMINLIKSILAGKDFTVIATDSSAGKRSGFTDIARVIAQLTAMGYKLDLAFWQDTDNWLKLQAEKPKARLTFPVCGANYKSPALLKNREELAKPPVKPALKLNGETAEKPATTDNNSFVNKNINPRPEIKNQTGEIQMKKNNYVNPSNQNLKFARESLNALQKLQQQTADLHKKFLEGQEQAQNTILALISNSVPNTQAGKQVGISQNVEQSYNNAPAATETNYPAPSAPAQAPIAPEPETMAKTPQTPAQPKPQAAVESSKISETLLAIVSEKTGYPADMLNLEMDMEADLGIDSIKRVEIMSAIQEKLPDAPVVQPDQLGKLRTLSQIIEHLNQASPSSPSTAGESPAQSTSSDELTPVLMEIVSEKTGYPADMLNPEMDMEADLGIDSIKRVEIMSAIQEKLPDAPVVQPDQLGKLRTLNQIIEHLSQASTSGATATEESPAQSTSSDELTPVLMEIVGEKTGYPADMLNPEMDMEADLGIDSIKRVEIMSALQEKLPNAPVVQPDQLGKLRTLNQIIEFISPAASKTTESNNSTTTSPTTPNNSAKIEDTLIEVIAEKTGYPADMLNPEMDMEADLGIDSIKRVEIMSAMQEKNPETPVVQPSDLGKFHTIGQIIDFLTTPQENNAQTREPALEQTQEPQLEKKSAPDSEDFSLKRTVLKTVELSNEPEGEVIVNKNDQVLVTIDGAGFSDSVAAELEKFGCKVELKTFAEIQNSDFSKDTRGIIVLAPAPKRGNKGYWPENSVEYIKDAFMAVQKVGSVIKEHKGFIATVSRLDGAFALNNPTKTIDPIQGALAGLTKTIRYEWPEVVSRAIDLDYRFKDKEAAAQKLVKEITHQGPTETGLTRSSRFTLKEENIDLKENPEAKTFLNKDDVVVITGGARGVTAATAIEMAGKYKCAFALLGRSRLEENEPSWLTDLTGEAAIKKAIIENSDTKLTPVQVESRFKAVKSSREIRNNLRKIEAEGARAKYYSADIRDEKAINTVLPVIQKDLGQITGIIHGAGVLRDKKIEDKTRDQLNDVIDTKVKGLHNLLTNLSSNNLKTVILFSSFSGRYGRAGQVDYAMANEALNKIAAKLRVIHSESKIIAFNWGPWDGGMVTPSLRNVFLAEGIGLIPLQRGGFQPVIELSHPELFDCEIGIVGQIKQKNTSDLKGETLGKKWQKAFDYELKLDSNAWLKDHVINGEAVLPMAVAGEMLAHVAVMQYPGLSFSGYNNLQILKGIVLETGKKKIEFYFSEPVKENDKYLVQTEISSSYKGHRITNVKAEIILVENFHETKSVEPIDCDYHLVYPDSIRESYATDLFHGEFFQALEEIYGWSEKGIAARCKAALPP
ncbi:MAG: SDR family NAD(P)-dependent oxidoreductase, partial [Candidatus Rifleibacteriota bacterium]